MLDASNIIYVDSDAAVRALVDRIRHSVRTAIDTEADSLHHYFEKVCLLQVTVPAQADAPSQDFIVDPLAEGLDLSPVMQALSACPMLLLHGADYDLRMLRRDFNFQAQAIFDTMSAAQLLGYERFSYAALVERFIGVTLDKQGQKADWSRRPLPEKLIHYAAGDTHYLAEVADRLKEELRAAGRLAWHEEVCAKLLPEVAEGMRLPDEERQWRIKGWHTLRSARAQGFLRELWRWRDSEARRADLPPFKVVRNETLIDLAVWAHSGRNPNERPPLPRTFVGRRLRAMYDALDLAATLPEEELPKPLSAPRREFPPLDEQMFAALKSVRDRHAQELKMDPGVLLPGSALTAIAVARPATVEELQAAGDLYNWQTEVMGSELLRAVDEHRSNPVPDQPPQRSARRRSGGERLNGNGRTDDLLASSDDAGLSQDLNPAAATDAPAPGPKPGGEDPEL